MSLKVRRLERELGVRLLERIGRRVTPTAAGAELLVHVERLRAAHAAAIAAIAPHREGTTGRVAIGTGGDRLPAFPARPAATSARRLSRSRSDRADRRHRRHAGRARGQSHRHRGRHPAGVRPNLRSGGPAGRPDGGGAAGRGRAGPGWSGGRRTREPSADPLRIARLDPSHRRRLVRLRRRRGAAGDGTGERRDDPPVGRSGGSASPSCRLSPFPSTRGAEGLDIRPLDPPLVRRLGIVRRRDKVQDPGMRAMLAALREAAADRPA